MNPSVMRCSLYSRHVTPTSGDLVECPHSWLTSYSKFCFPCIGQSLKSLLSNSIFPAIVFPLGCWKSCLQDQQEETSGDQETGKCWKLHKRTRESRLGPECGAKCLKGCHGTKMCREMVVTQGAEQNLNYVPQSPI